MVAKGELKTRLTDLLNDVDEAFDAITLETLIEHLDYTESPDDDPFETRDNTATLIASFYHVIKYFMTMEQYDEFISNRRNKDLVY